jgi:A/G-specific adenine glycosylase
MNNPQQNKQIYRLRRSLLAWYDREGRTLLWRTRPEDREEGHVPAPYKIWLSEIMCQQTTTTSAAPYWLKFLEKWPTIQDLAASPRDEVLSAWAGLGYYARARNLHKCARVIVDEYGGSFPLNESQLLTLPGIGPYSAAAIAAICAREFTNVVDGNVERVIARLRAVETALPAAKPEIKKLAAVIAQPQKPQDKRPDDYAQALMDLGSSVCKPKNPLCEECPWNFACEARRLGVQSELPRRAQKGQRPTRYGAVFYVENDGHIWLNRRAESGLLGGMMELPGTAWTDKKPAEDTWLAAAPLLKNWHRSGQDITHVFSHFTLILSVYMTNDHQVFKGITAPLDQLENYALPTLMQKAIKEAQRSLEE